MLLLESRFFRQAKGRILFYFLFSVVAFAFVSPLFAKPHHLGHGDWLWHHFVWDAARKTILDYHELPWWNPYYCGGNIGIANPQSFGLSPFFWLLLPLPTALAMKVHLWVMITLAQCGAFELALHQKASKVAAVVAAIAFGCSGFFGWHINGQTGMAMFALLPWVTLFFLLGYQNYRYCIAAGAAMACMVVTAGVYPTALTAVAVTILTVVSPFTQSNRLTTDAVLSFRNAILTALFMIGFSAPKLIPMLDFLDDHKRPIASDDTLSISLFFQALLEQRTTETQIWTHSPPHYAWWGEYGNYIGKTGVVLWFLSLAYALYRRSVWTVAIVLFAAVILGDHGQVSPYYWIRKLPILSNLRVPTRYFVVLNLFMIIPLSSMITGLQHSLPKRIPVVARIPWRLALAAVLVFWVVDLVNTNGRAVLAGAMQTAPAPEVQPDRPYSQTNGHPWQMYKGPPLNQGTLRCFDEVYVEISPALRSDSPSQVFLKDPLAGEVKLVKWSPNQWIIEGQLNRPTTIVLNQNWFRGWVSDIGEVRADRGLISLPVQAGTFHTSISYYPIGAKTGWGLFGMTLTVALFALRQRQVRQYIGI